MSGGYYPLDNIIWIWANEGNNLLEHIVRHFVQPKWPAMVANERTAITASLKHNLRSSPDRETCWRNIVGDKFKKIYFVFKLVKIMATEIKRVHRVGTLSNRFSRALSGPILKRTHHCLRPQTTLFEFRFEFQYRSVVND